MISTAVQPRWLLQNDFFKEHGPGPMAIELLIKSICHDSVVLSPQLD